MHALQLIFFCLPDKPPPKIENERAELDIGASRGRFYLAFNGGGGVLRSYFYVGRQIYGEILLRPVYDNIVFLIAFFNDPATSKVSRNVDNAVSGASAACSSLFSSIKHCFLAVCL